MLFEVCKQVGFIGHCSALANDHRCDSFHVLQGVRFWTHRWCCVACTSFALRVVADATNHSKDRHKRRPSCLLHSPHSLRTTRTSRSVSCMQNMREQRKLFAHGTSVARMGASTFDVDHSGLFYDLHNVAAVAICGMYRSIMSGTTPYRAYRPGVRAKETSGTTPVLCVRLASGANLAREIVREG